MHRPSHILNIPPPMQLLQLTHTQRFYNESLGTLSWRHIRREYNTEEEKNGYVVFKWSTNQLGRRWQYTKYSAYRVCWARICKRFWSPGTARLGIDSWAPLKVYKNGLRVPVVRIGTPAPSPAGECVPSPFGSGGWDTACRRRVGRGGPNLHEGQTLW